MSKLKVKVLMDYGKYEYLEGLKKAQDGDLKSVKDELAEPKPLTGEISELNSEIAEQGAKVDSATGELPPPSPALPDQTEILSASAIKNVKKKK
ncbi:MAG TPA: hypothetical protein VIY47_00160, partial [Ignavibacteriaceae bacterium]